MSGGALLPTGLFNIVKGCHLQLRSHPFLFHNFKQFNIKAVALHHSIIQQEVDEMLAKGAIEPSPDSAVFSSSVLFPSILVVFGPYLT